MPRTTRMASAAAPPAKVALLAALLALLLAAATAQPRGPRLQGAASRKLLQGESILAWPDAGLLVAAN